MKRISPEKCKHVRTQEIKMGRWFGSKTQELYKIACLDCGTGDGYVVRYEYREKNKTME